MLLKKDQPERTGRMALAKDSTQRHSSALNVSGLVEKVMGLVRIVLVTYVS